MTGYLQLAPKVGGDNIACVSMFGFPENRSDPVKYIYFKGGEIYEISSKTGKSVNASGGSTANLWYPHGYRILVMSGNYAGWRHSWRSQSDRSVSG